MWWRRVHPIARTRARATLGALAVAFPEFADFHFAFDALAVARTRALRPIALALLARLSLLLLLAADFTPDLAAGFVGPATLGGESRAGGGHEAANGERDGGTKDLICIHKIALAWTLTEDVLVTEDFPDCPA